MRPTPDWNPDDAAASEQLYGLPHEPDEAAVRVIPVPFEATVSYGAGTAEAPERVRAASWQVDLDGGPYLEGVAMEPVHPELAAWNQEAGAAVERCRGGAEEHGRVDAIGDRVNAWVQGRTEAAFSAGQIPAILGGDHSVPVGAVWAAAARFPGLGLLHIDAHADLRVAYEGFRWSHASAVHNMLGEGIEAVVSVGLRDLGRAERAAAEADPRLHHCTDQAWARRLHEGVPLQQTLRELLAPLPEQIWITWDIDGLDPALCPGTGTPVPGGLSWREANALLDAVEESGRRVLGFDLVEVGPGEYDANVGARLLWRLAGLAVRSQASGAGSSLSR